MPSLHLSLLISRCQILLKKRPLKIMLTTFIFPPRHINSTKLYHPNPHKPYITKQIHIFAFIHYLNYYLGPKYY